MKRLMRKWNDSQFFAITVLIVAGCLTITLASNGQFTKIQKSQDEAGVTLSFVSDASSYNQIWSSENLEEWSIDGMVLGAEGGAAWSADWLEDTTNGSARFYRVFTKSLLNPDDADGDGFDDVYELTHGEAGWDPLVANPATITSIEVAATEIAAGGVESEPHQTLVTIQVTPAASYPVAVWLEGGDGYGTESSQHFTGASISEAGPARIAWEGQTFVAGIGNSNNRAIQVITDGSGRAVLELTSSNEVDEECTVHARAGTSLEIGASQAQSSPVRFEKGTLEVVFPQTLLTDGVAEAKASLTWRGQPLDGHSVIFFVSRVIIKGEDKQLNPGDPLGLSAYAAVNEDEELRISDQYGQANAFVRIKAIEGLEYVEVKVQDVQTFGE